MAPEAKSSALTFQCKECSNKLQEHTKIPKVPNFLKGEEAL